MSLTKASHMAVSFFEVVEKPEKGELETSCLQHLDTVQWVSGDS